MKKYEENKRRNREDFVERRGRGERKEEVENKEELEEKMVIEEEGYEE